VAQSIKWHNAALQALGDCVLHRQGQLSLEKYHTLTTHIQCDTFVNFFTAVFDIDNLVWLNVCFQEEVPQIQHSELTDLTVIGQGGYGVVHRAKHGRFGTVVYKELNTQILGERYSQAILLQYNSHAKLISLII